MKRILSMTLALGALVAGVMADEAPLKVFVFAGQSNMLGKRAKAADLPTELQGEQKDALFFNGTEWTPLAPGKTEVEGFGPEISCAKVLASRLKEPIGVIKHSVGGTTLGHQWAPSNPKSLFIELRAKVKAAQGSRKIEIVGMFWMQGESDAQKQVLAEPYQKNLEAFIKTARQEFASSNMVFVAGRVNPEPEKFPFVDVVRKAQEACNDARYAFIDCDSLPKGPDHLHYTTQGVVEMGNRFAEAALKLITAPGK